MAWDETKHPRVPKGAGGGGEFTRVSRLAQSALKRLQDRPIPRASTGSSQHRLQPGVQFVVPGDPNGMDVAYKVLEHMSGGRYKVRVAVGRKVGRTFRAIRTHTTSFSVESLHVLHDKRMRD